MADKVSFKVCLKNLKRGKVGRKQMYARQEEEVRRFLLDRDLSINLLSLQQKIFEIFPDLLQKVYFLSWTDEDGDSVTISTDEDLAIALTEMKGPIFKLDANVRGIKKVERIVDEKDLVSQNCNTVDKKLPQEERGRIKFCTPSLHGKEGHKKNTNEKKSKRGTLRYTEGSHQELARMLRKLLGDTIQSSGRKHNKTIKMKVKIQIKTKPRKESRSNSPSSSSNSSSSASSSSNSSSSSSSSSSSRSSSSSSMSRSTSRSKHKHEHEHEHEHHSKPSKTKKRSKSKSKKGSKKGKKTSKKRTTKVKASTEKKNEMVLIKNTANPDDDWTVVTEKKRENEKDAQRKEETKNF